MLTFETDLREENETSIFNARSPWSGLETRHVIFCFSSVCWVFVLTAKVKDTVKCQQRYHHHHTSTDIIHQTKGTDISGEHPPAGPQERLLNISISTGHQHFCHVIGKIFESVCVFLFCHIPNFKNTRTNMSISAFMKTCVHTWIWCWCFCVYTASDIVDKCTVQRTLQIYACVCVCMFFTHEVFTGKLPENCSKQIMCEQDVCV